MKLKFKQQAYQTHAVESVVNCFAGQPYQAGISYKLDNNGVKLPLKYSSKCRVYKRSVIHLCISNNFGA